MREVSICVAHYLVLNLYVIQQQALLLLLTAITHLTASHWVNRDILVVYVGFFLC